MTDATLPSRLRRLVPGALLLLLLVAPVARGGDAPPTAADVTERGRKVDNILDVILGPQPGVVPDARVVVFLLDATASLQRAEFAAELEDAVHRNERRMPGLRLGVARVGQAEPLVVTPTVERDPVLDGARAIVAAPSGAFQNVYEDVRRVADALRKEEGLKEIVLVTLENGDAEDDIEGTVKDLARAGVRVHVIAREAFLSDSLYVLYPPKGPPGTTFTGSDSAFVELPWSFRFQWQPANVRVLSGFAMYGLTRLAAATGGRVFLYYPSSGEGHVCDAPPYCYCPFCPGDHHPVGQAYQAQRLRAIAPLAGTRDEAMRVAAADPYYRAVQRAWEDAMRGGLVYVRPSLDRQAGGVRIEPNPYRGWVPLGSTASFPGEANRARRLRRDCQQILGELERGIEKGRKEGGRERYRAVAEATRILLLVTRFNLWHFEVFCEQVAPEIAARRPEGDVPPEKSPYGSGDRVLGIGYHDLSLCHGVEPFLRLRLPGGDATTEMLRDLAKEFDGFCYRWRNTPYAEIARRSGLARYWLVVRPGYTPPGKRRVPDSAKDEVTTLPERPQRAARPGTGTSGGEAPVTGDG